VSESAGQKRALPTIYDVARLAGVSTPTIDALINLAGLAVGIDYMRDGLTLERLGLSGKSPSELLRFVEDGA